MENKYADIVWVPKDIQRLKPNWTLDQCENFLSENEGHIRDRSIELTWDVINDLLPGE